MIKKRFIILIIAFAVALASFAGVFAFGLEQFKVEHQMETIFGNPSDANGLTISYALKSGKNANWEMEYKLENGSFTPKTHFWSTSLKHNIENFNLNHYKISYDDAENSYMGAYRGYDTDAIEQMYRDKFNEEPFEGTRIEFSVPLKEIQEYYTPFISIYTGTMNTSPFASSPNTTRDEELLFWSKFYDFFKIPVIDAETLQITAIKTNNNTNQNTKLAVIANNDYGSDIYGFDSVSALSDDALYFAFSNRTTYGLRADFSQVSGGYGVYKMPYNKTEDTSIEYKEGVLDIDRLENILSLDESAKVDHMGLSSDGSHLYLVINDGQVTFKSLNLKTNKIDQEFVIYTTPNYRFVVGDRFLSFQVINKEDTRLRVLYETDGKYDMIVDTRVNYHDRFDYRMFEFGTTNCACDGKRFVTAAFNNHYIDKDYSSWQDEGSGIMIAVYEGTVLKYYGIYKSSLEKCNVYNLYTSAGLYTGTSDGLPSDVANVLGNSRFNIRSRDTEIHLKFE